MRKWSKVIIVSSFAPINFKRNDMFVYIGTKYSCQIYRSLVLKYYTPLLLVDFASQKSPFGVHCKWRKKQRGKPNGHFPLYTPNRHPLQLSMPQLREVWCDLYQKIAPDELVHCKNVEQCKVSDVSVLTLMLFQAEIGMKAQRRFYQLICNFFGFTGLERSRFYLRARYLTPLFRLIRPYFNQLDFDELVIIDSFPILLC